MASPEPVSEVLANEYKKPFLLIVALGVILATVLFVLSSAEKFVDGRVDLKLATQQRRSEEQEKRISRVEEQFSLMRDTLAEIRADVRVLRASVEGAREPAASHRP